MESWIRSYLRATWRMVLAFALLMALFHAVLLVSYPLTGAWDDIGYLDLLIGSLAAALYGYGFLSYRSRHRIWRDALSGANSLVPVASEPASDDDIRWMRACAMHESRVGAERVAALEEQLGDQRDVLTRWAHDVKTPLAVCELILARVPDAEARDMRRELTRMRSLVAHVMHIERLHHLHRSLHEHPLNLRDALRAAVSRNAPLLQARALEIDIDAPPMEAMGDADAVAYILDQLLGNAAKYAPTGSLVRLSARQTANGAVLCVRDAGPGIPEQDIARVFDKGFVGENGRGREASSGMGLYYARRTALALGGTLDVRSVPGDTAFELFLPRFADYLNPARV